MADILDDMISKLTVIRSTLPEIAVKVLEDAAPQIEDLNIGQLQLGQRSDGSFLPDYSPVSVKKFGKPSGPIKLFDQGDFYRGIKLEIFSTNLGITDTDSKADMLVDRYGPEILGLSDSAIQTVQDDILLPGIQYEVDQILSA